MIEADWEPAEMARAKALASRLGRAPARLFAARAPGRVNLIGEHTDYSGLPVLPAAIDRSTILVASREEAQTLKVRNLDPRYPARSFRLERKIGPFPPGDWGNYVKAAVQGVIDRFAARGVDSGRLRGGVMAVDGRVPIAAGLSSSAALTVASALAFMAINGLDLAPIETAEMVARSEWYVGTMTGGMDQAASLLGRRGHALYIEFRPLRVQAVRMPAQAALVAADSREAADKSGKVRAEYNRRVIECALAARILARRLGLANVRILGDVVAQVGAPAAANLAAQLADLPAGISLREAARMLDTEPDLLERDLQSQEAAPIDVAALGPLQVFRRARHVLSENARVGRARAALEAGRLAEVGELMNASHRSLAGDFAVSTERLDLMVDCARRAGALGARLTGAGFGGSIIALCRLADAQAVIAALDRDCYAKLGGSIDLAASRTVLCPSAGAGVVELT